MRAWTSRLVGVTAGLLIAHPAAAADLGVAAKKLVIVDKLVAAGKAKAVFVAADAAVTKGSGTDPNTISLDLSIAYQGESAAASGSFSVPAGASDGTVGWATNKDTVAKFVNKNAPGGPTSVKVATIKPGTSAKIVGKSLGDAAIDLIASGAPMTDVCVATVVDNGGEVNRLCTRFPLDVVAFSSIAGDTGRKLVAKNGIADPDCAVCGAGLPTTTSSVTSTSTSSTTSTSLPGATTTSTSTSTSSSTSSSIVASSSTSTTTSTTTSTVIPALCGNGVLNAGETCDDGNHSDNDGCPADCFIAACTPIAGTVRQVTVSFTPPAGLDVAGLTLLLNYPEQKVFMPPAGPSTQIGSTNFVPSYPPADVFIRGADLGTTGISSGFAVRGVVADSTPVPAGPIFQLKFQDCQGAAAPIPGEFNCTVLDASDAFSNPISGVKCSVTIP